MKEIWKDIKGYEGSYQVSNLGRVKSLSREIYFSNRDYINLTKEIILKPGNNGKGYLCVSFSKNNRQKSFRVHRLVAKAFIPNLKNKPQVNHKDGDKKNNCIENLEWCDNYENFQHALKNNLIASGVRAGMSKLTKRQVLEICKDSRSFRVLGKIYGVNSSNISDIKNRKSWKRITKHIEIIKGRNYNTKLSEDIVIKIRNETGTLQNIANKYELTKGTVGKIKNKQLWKHI